MEETNNDSTIETIGEGFELSDVTTGSAYGNMSKIYGNALYGINRYEILDTRESPTDHVGFTFFTRPMMNMSAENIKHDRLLLGFMSKLDNDVKNYCRIMLDRLVQKNEGITCEFADNLSAFIPILSNNLRNLSGHVDISVDSYVSPSGARKQQYNMLDGTDEINESLDFTASFINTYDDAVYSLFGIWLRYMVKVKEGILSPYPGFIARRLVDSHSRIFRLVTTEDKRFVKRISATGPIYPDVHSVGKYFDVNEDERYTKVTKTHEVKFKAMGLEYNDNILIREFNKTVGFFNPAMRKIANGASPESVGMIELTPQGELYVQFKGYPLIEEGFTGQGNRLKWYVFGTKN